MASNNVVFNESFISSKLRTFSDPERLSMIHEGFIKSAVIVLLIPMNDQPYQLVLICRTKKKEDKHSGEMAFPGGIFDPKKDDSLRSTALRELEEELSISREHVKILGCLDDHLTPKGFIITPFVGYIYKSLKMTKQEEEIKEIIHIPITFFLNKKNYKERIYMIKNDKIGVGKFQYTAPNKNKYVIFGATSHIIVNYIDTVYEIGLMTPGIRRIKPEDIAHRIVK
ncbi:MAG: NUDIX hydrolase [Promethearchaeota archaeon]